jgi:predicted nucleic-acid-binding Zn-ribbon protein
MAMDQHQAKAMFGHLNALGINLVCPVCGCKQISSGRIINPAEVTRSGESISGGNAGALAQAHCCRCGYTWLFDCSIARIPV